MTYNVRGMICVELSEVPTKSHRTSLPSKTGLGGHTPRACAAMCSLSMTIVIVICVESSVHAVRVCMQGTTVSEDQHAHVCMLISHH